MLVEALSSLANKVGAERISLEIGPSEGGECSVLVVTSLGHTARTSESEENRRLVAALAEPLAMNGHAGELDSRLVRMIDEIEDEFEVAAKALPETDVQRQRRKLKEAAKKDDDKSEEAAAKSSDDAKDAENKDGDAEEKTHAEALADGEADTL